MRALAPLALLLLFATTSCKGKDETTSPSETKTAKAPPQTTALGGPELVELAAGADHMCARRASGKVLCWGSNSDGQLGVTGMRETPIPQPVSRLAGATRIVAGSHHSCALISTGQVLCWGSNGAGQLGDGRGRPGVQSQGPVAVRGLQDAISLTAGDDHTCALRKSGAVVCWGDNRGGQAGSSGRAVWVAPVIVKGVRDAVALTAGRAHTCAVSGDRRVFCWGEGGRGQLGDGSKGRRPSAAPVPGLSKIKAIAAAGDHTCALRPQGDVVCWGENRDGQAGVKPAGDGTRPGPGAVSGLRGVAAIAVGRRHSCARLSSGRALCWGNNDEGELGDGTLQSHSQAVPVSGIQDIRDLALGDDHSCALTGSGAVLCWGSNRGSLLGELPPPAVDDGSRRTVKGLEGAAGVTAGAAFSCAPLGTGNVACWGANDRGQLGNGKPGKGGMIPVQVRKLSDAVDVSAGRAHACARRRSGQVVCWGANDLGQLGDGGNRKKDHSTPSPVAGLSDAVQIEAGRDHTCARRSNGSVVCWGEGGQGQLGHGKSQSSTRAARVSSLSGIVDISAGGSHSCARSANGAVSCWGANTKGQLGNGAGAADLGVPQPKPVQVRKLPDSTGLALGENHSCSRRSTGGVACWGGGGSGALGAGTSNDWTMRVPVTNLRGVVDLSSGDNHVCALTAGGLLQCWGDNSKGALGEAPRSIHKTPILSQRIADATSIAAGQNHTCARTKSGRVQCWGDNKEGQLGEGETVRSMIPVAIAGF